MENEVFLYSVIKTNLRTLVNNHKVGENNKHFILTCPECEEKLDYHQAKLYITKDYKVGFCQRCKSKFFNEIAIGSSIDELVTPSFNFVKDEEFTLDRIDCSYVNDSLDLNEGNINYLKNRYSKFTFETEINKTSEKYKEKYFGSYKEPNHSLLECKFKGRNNKIVIPFYWNNELIYYQIRNQPPYDSEKRYFMPVINHKPIYSSIFNSNDNKIGILCEGVFGAIATSFKYDFKYNTYALQGSYITDYQLWMIESIGLHKLVLYFDDFEISLNIRKKLIARSKIMYENTEIINSKYHDPELDYLGNYMQEIHDISWIPSKLF